MERIPVTSWNQALQFKDHTDRYVLARSFLKHKATVLDAACGAGYGTFYLASDEKAERVIGVDCSWDTITHAGKFFKSPKTDFYRKNLELDKTLFHCYFDLITCFETLEHLDNDQIFLKRLRQVMNKESLLFLSVPSEEFHPFATNFNPYHFRHYRADDITNLLLQCGLEPQKAFVQDYSLPEIPLREEMGRYSNLFMCKRRM